MTQKPIELTVDDMTALIQTDETSRLKVQGIALQRRNAELEEENAALKAQIAEPDTTTMTNNKNDSKLTAVGAD
jgi:cell division protein FtsB